MSVSFVSNSAVAYSAAAGTTITVTKPAGTAENDLLIAIIHWDTTVPDTTDISPPDGTWTELDDSRNGTDTSRSATFWKIAGDSEGADYTFSQSGAADGEQRSGLLRTYRGTDLTTPISHFPTPTDTNGSSKTTAPAPTANVARDGSMLVCAWTVDSSRAGETYPGSMGNSTEGGGSGSSIAAADEAVNVADSPTGTRTLTFTAHTSTEKGYSMALQPTEGTAIQAVMRRPNPLLRM